MKTKLTGLAIRILVIIAAVVYVFFSRKKQTAEISGYLGGEKIGLTSSCEVGVEIFPEDPACTEELYYMLDGKTILIESDLVKEGANVGRRNYTVSHESCHHILKLLFPRDYGAQARGRSVHYCYRSNRRNGDWEEWQVETLAAIILLPP